MVHHGRLIEKLGMLGLDRGALQWIGSSYETLANGKTSDFIQVAYGVPQGSIMGPLLFSVYVNELPDIVQNSSMLLYTDDAVLITNGFTPEEIELRAQLDLIKVFNWACTNRLTINEKKTKLVTYGTQLRLDTTRKIVLTIDKKQISNETMFVYLGISLDQTLLLKPHMASVSKRTGYKIRQLHKIRDEVDRGIALSMYKTCILPTLEYCSFLFQGLCNGKGPAAPTNPPE